MNKLEGKIAVITGGNSGIGLATAKEFQTEGAKVVVVGRNSETLDATRRELAKDTLVLQADVSNLGDLDRVYAEVKKQFGRIDVIFANAGVAKFVPVSEVNEDLYDWMMNINVKGLFFTIQKALPLLNKGASVILTSSSIQSRAMQGGAVYAASKAAVRSLGRGFAVDLAESGIRVNVLSPGPIETPIFSKMGFSPEQVKAMASNISDRTPLKRFGRPEEIAKAALFLASADSSFVFGAEIAVDGGVAQL